MKFVPSKYCSNRSRENQKRIRLTGLSKYKSPKAVQGIIHNRFGKLLVQKIAGVINGRVYWFCSCACGTSGFIAKANSLRVGKTNSCGCKNVISNGNQKHLMSKTREYKVWAAMKARCHNPKNKHYCNYGARGIFVCDEWINSFDVFISDMGYKPSKHYSLDRFDNNKGYSKQNCRWATKKEQANNQRNNHNINYIGLTMNLKGWAKYLNIKYDTLKARVQMYGAQKAIEKSYLSRNIKKDTI